MLGRKPCKIEVCLSCEARAQRRGSLDKDVVPLVKKMLRARGIKGAQVKGVQCLLKCPLDGVSVRAGGVEGERYSGELRVFYEGFVDEACASWAAQKCQARLDEIAAQGAGS